MPNQDNFRSDVTTITDPRFSASRVVRIPSEEILFDQIPASFGYEQDDNIELHFYTIPGNELILSTVLKLSDEIIKSHTVFYTDQTEKNHLRIDFSEIFRKKQLMLVPGDYRMVMNFFSDEIGSYENKKLNVTTISPSRQEIELTFNDSIDEVSIDDNQRLVYEFVEISFDKIYAVFVADKIFKSGVELNDETEGLTPSNILTENDISLLDNLGVRQQFETELSSFLLELGDFIKNDLVIRGDSLIQKDQYKNLIIDAVLEKINYMQSRFPTIVIT